MNSDGERIAALSKNFPDKTAERSDPDALRKDLRKKLDDLIALQEQLQPYMLWRSRIEKAIGVVLMVFFNIGWATVRSVTRAVRT